MRRRLHLLSSSDEDDDNPHIVNLSNPNPNLNPTPNPNPNPNSSPNPPLVISDDDFVDAPETISPPSPPSIPNPSFDRNGPIDDFLRNLGLCLQPHWLDSCIAALSSSHPGFAGLDVSGKAKLCFSQFLFSDMNLSGRGILPPGVHAMHGVELTGPFVLQVDEIVNISLPLRERYHDVSSGFKRCLKLSMTDGAQHVVGMEYRPIRGLEVLAPAGLKVCIRNVHIRRGLLMLVPETLEVLGGLAEELDAAFHRLVQEVNKPPRGKRRRNGEVPSLVTRVQLAAWPTNVANDCPQANISRPQVANLSQPSGQVGSSATSSSNTLEAIREGCSISRGRSDIAAMSSSNTVRDSVTFFECSGDLGRRSTERFTASSSVPEAEGHPSSSNVVLDEQFLSPNSDGRGTIMEGFDPGNHRPDAEENTSSAVSAVESLATYSSYAGERTREGFSSPRTRPEVEAVPFLDNVLNDTTMVMLSSDTIGRSGKRLVTSSELDCQTNHSRNTVSVMEEIHRVDEVEHPLILSGDKETPFTYLAILMAKWTANKGSVAVVHGKIKCFLTGVKGFQFKQRSTYELHVYVDDGSLISEVLIDHNLVQNTIRHSPEEVTAALSSTDKKVVANMREIMKRYQHFLANFEGTMTVEISKHSSLPIALEMKQGSQTSDTWLLLRRVKAFIAPQAPQQIHSNAINISP